MNPWAASSLWLVALVHSLGANAEEIRAGSEFQVNTYTSGYQLLPAMAAELNGDFVVVWESAGQDSAGVLQSGIFAQRFSSAGMPFAEEFQVNSYTPSAQILPSIALDDDGDFVVAWMSAHQDGESGNLFFTFSIFARRFSSTGIPLAVEFQVNSYTIGRQSFPSVAADADGDFVIAWESQGQDRYGIFLQRFSRAGVPLGAELQVNSYTFGQSRPAIDADADGDFVVVWRNHVNGPPFPDLYDVVARRFSSAGAPLGGEFRVNTNSINYVVYPKPAIAAEADGDFVVTWEGVTADYCCVGLFARRYSSAGTPLASELEVTRNGVGLEILLSVASGANGDFVVVWDGSVADGSLEGIRGRHVSAAGVPIAAEFQVNSYTVGNQRFPAVATTAGGGGFVVAWSSYGGEGLEWDVSAPTDNEAAAEPGAAGATDGGRALGGLPLGKLRLRAIKERPAFARAGASRRAPPRPRSARRPRIRSRGTVPDSRRRRRSSSSG